MEIHKVLKTKSGLYFRNDGEYGGFVFSPFSGLIYGIHYSSTKNVFEYLENINAGNVDSVIKKCLGLGWDNNITVEHVKPHLLPSEGNWKNNNTDNPILINWLITGNCTHDCLYCYAEDLMRGRIEEPTEKTIEETAKIILSYNPLAIVLTGGEPLLSPYINKILDLIHGKAGIMIDTNGYALTDELIALFKKYDVVLRVSLDSPRPRVNDRLRPLKTKSKKVKKGFETSFNALCKALDAGITVVVQSVLTSENENELLEFGDLLVTLGVKAWRIQIVMPSNIKKEASIKLHAPKSKSKSKKNEKSYRFSIEELLSRYKYTWKECMSLQISNYGEKTVNNVILVSPDGNFYTEHVTGNKKVLIDEENPKKPTVNKIQNQVNSSSHFVRYMNI